MRTSAFLSLALAAIAFARPLADAEPCGDSNCTPGGGSVPPGGVVPGGAGASAHGDASASALGGGSANANANADASAYGGGCAHNCPPDPIGGTVQPGSLPAGPPGGVSQIQGGGSGQIPGGDSSQIHGGGSGGGSGGVPGGISGGGLGGGFGTTYFYYSWTQSISTQVTTQFNQQLQSCGMQPSSTIGDLLAALQLQEQVTIQQFLIALLGVESYLSQIISLIINILSNFGCSPQSSLAVFLNACGLTPQQPIYILFLKFGIWQPACQTC